MRINKLELKNFRKFKNLRLEFKPGINLITGLNGSGKTTLLNAIGFAIYGDLVNGTNLRDNLRYGQKGQSKVGFVNLDIINSVNLNITRKIRLKDKIASQWTVCNGNFIPSHSDISEIEQSLPQKDVFFEIAYIDNIRQDLTDLNKKDFRQTLSRKMLPWDMQKVLDNTKALSLYLDTKENELKRILDGKKEEIKELISKEDLVSSLKDEHKELSNKIEEIQKTKEELEKRRISGEKYEKYASGSLEQMEKTLKQIQRLVGKLKIGQYIHKDFIEEKIVSSTLNSYLNEYIEKVSFLYTQIQEIGALLRKITQIQTDLQNERQKAEKDLIMKINDQNRNLAYTVAKLETISHQISISEQYLEEKQKINRVIMERQNDIEKYRTDIVIAERLRGLITSMWNGSISSFFRRIENRSNELLKLLKIDVCLQITEEEIVANIEGIKTDSALFSAGEEGLFNILVRIAILQELGQTSLLILEDPIAHFDQVRTKSFLSMLNSLKNDFSQIIMTSHSFDLEFDVENRIVLDP